MDLDALLLHYFGTADVEELTEGDLEAGIERARITLGTERDPGRRFALWAFLHALGHAPDPTATFKNLAERKLAEDYAWEADKIAYRADQQSR